MFSGKDTTTLTQMEEAIRSSDKKEELKNLHSQFAIAALTALIPILHPKSTDVRPIVKQAFEYADAALEAMEKR